MNHRHFSDRSPGKLVSIETPRGRDIAFVPFENLGQWEFDPALWSLLVDAKEALGTLNGIGQTLPDPQLLLRPLQSREAIASSNIEGTFVTPEQLLLFELDPSTPTSSTDKRSDWLEVVNYQRALNEGSRMLKTLPICNRLIKSMHRILMRGPHGRSKMPGEFRNLQVQIGSQGRFIPPPASEVERLMTNLEQYINSKDKGHDALIRSFLIHYQFETIHPFADGNGRVGRALLALMIQHWLGHSHPWLYMSAFFEQHKDEYVESLYDVSSKGSWSHWVELCLRGTIIQARDSVSRCHQFNQLKRDFHSRVKKTSPRTYNIIESLFVNPILFVSTIMKQFSIAYPTAKADLKRLVDVGILQELDNIYPRAYRCREILNVSFAAQPESTLPNSDSNEQQQLSSPQPFVAPD